MLSDAAMMSGQNQARANVCQRLQHEAPQMQTLMRDDQHRISADKVARIEQIEIQRARRILLTHCGPPHRLLHRLQTRVHLLRRAIRLHFNDAVQEGLGLRRAVHRRRFITASRKYPHRLHLLDEQGDAALQVGSAISKVGAESDAKGLVCGGLQCLTIVYVLGQTIVNSGYCFSPSTSCMSYRPAGLPFSQRAARTAPPAKVSRLLALWVSSTRSPTLAKTTV